MTLDIKRGDLLIHDGEAYPVAAVPNWSMARMSAQSFLRLATLTVKTKRAQNTGGKINPASSSADHLTGLRAFPLDPLDGATMTAADKMGLSKPAELLQTFITDGNSFVQVLLEHKI